MVEAPTLLSVDTGSFLSMTLTKHRKTVFRPFCLTLNNKEASEKQIASVLAESLFLSKTVTEISSTFCGNQEVGSSSLLVALG